MTFCSLIFDKICFCLPAFFLREPGNPSTQERETRKKKKTKKQIAHIESAARRLSFGWDFVHNLKSNRLSLFQALRDNGAVKEKKLQVNKKTGEILFLFARCVSFAPYYLNA